MIGHRKMIYTIDKADKKREPIRKITIDFFKQELGFKDSDIFFVDRNEFLGCNNILFPVFRELFSVVVLHMLGNCGRVCSAFPEMPKTPASPLE